ncbi:MAG: ATP-dependent RNA helicase RhlE [Parcubacteria group bacterium ADurb.Bin247]|jgi:ATP-dependent RNA helicase RhlE|nr:MAG: ATP-dependent RNA helicase RhlE [Parcubacteria group bacterium ADurb.Bin247]HQB85291.1 DEAD/DEAH box helicase [Candidatus Pacearchaeota archaeon]
MTQAKMFDSLGVDLKILRILKEKGFINPTPIQSQCIPEAIKGNDIVGIAQTGTGKTLAYSVPMLQRLTSARGQALVLVPTRELAIQVEEMIFKISKGLNIKTSTIIGGEPYHQQIRSLRSSPDIIIATPGRLIDHLKKKVFRLDKINMVVLDEADRMFDIGFLPEIKEILSLTPKEKQVLLFSATMPNAITDIAYAYMKIPVRIEVAPQGTVAENIIQELFIVDNRSKISLLQSVLKENKGTVLVFSRTKIGAKKISRAIAAMDDSAIEIHSDRSLFQRKEAIRGFKSGKYRILVATDIAARGIDVSNISLVINYDLPENSGDYVHRIGRTGRAGSNGLAISFVTPNQRRNIKQIERLIKKNISIKSLPKLDKVNQKVFDAMKNENEYKEYRHYRPRRSR